MTDRLPTAFEVEVLRAVNEWRGEGVPTVEDIAAVIYQGEAINQGHRVALIEAVEWLTAFRFLEPVA